MYDSLYNSLHLVILYIYTYTTHLLTDDEIHLNSRTFILPGELEEVLDLSAARLSVVRDNLEMALRLVLLYLNVLSIVNSFSILLKYSTATDAYSLRNY